MHAGPPERAASLPARALAPALVTALAMILLVGVLIVRAGGDPLELARLGTRFKDGNPAGTEGYDGQFVYYIARDLNPRQVAAHLDVPAYRYQRILLPLLANVLTAGNESLIPWVLPLIGILAQALGTWCVALMLLRWGRGRWCALIYGLWVGFTLAVRLDLPEPLAYGLVAGALLATLTGRLRLGWLLYGLALFAREVTALFLLAQLAADLWQRRWGRAIGLVMVAVVPFLIFQGWLWSVFGAPGLGSGGTYATPFEWIPFWGFLRVGQASLLVLGVYVLVFGPTVILPALAGIWQSARRILAQEAGVIPFALLANALVIPFLPFSTFREPGGLLRFVSGLVLAWLLFAGRYNMRRVLNYAWFSLFLTVFLIE